MPSTSICGVRVAAPMVARCMVLNDPEISASTSDGRLSARPWSALFRFSTVSWSLHAAMLAHATPASTIRYSFFIVFLRGDRAPGLRRAPRFASRLEARGQAERERAQVRERERVVRVDGRAVRRPAGLP